MKRFDYLDSPCLLQRIRDVLFWRPVRGQAAGPFAGKHV